jgi:hypothetical protein
MAEAESALQDGEVQIAESRYRDALMRGWLLVSLEASDNRMLQARDACRAPPHRRWRRGGSEILAMALLQTGDVTEALGLLTQLASRSPKTRRPRPAR